MISVPPQFSLLLVIVVGCTDGLSSSSGNATAASTDSTIDEQSYNRYAMASSFLEEKGASRVRGPVVDTVAAMQALPGEWIFM